MSCSWPMVGTAPETRPQATSAPRLAGAVRDVLIVGCGVLGSRIAEGAVRSGLSLGLCDFDLGDPDNLPRQAVEVGVPKALTVAATSNAIRPGSAEAHVADVRHLGPGLLLRYRCLLDATDDRSLRLPLTLLSNGSRIPVVRSALDGTGERALGRVRVGHGGLERSCLCCHAGWQDLLEPSARTPCPGEAAWRPRTRAGVPIAMASAGLALHAVQEILAGREEEVVDREIFLDLAGALLTGSIARHERCLSSHEVWQPEPLARRADETTLGELFALASHELGERVELEVFAHPIWPGARCPACGSWTLAPATRWAPAPLCGCGARTERRPEGAMAALDEPLARELGIQDETCLALGMPALGALVSARVPGRTPRRFLLE